MRSRFAARAGRLTAVASSRCRGRSRRLEYANSFEAGDRLAGWSRADSNIGPDSVTNTVYLYAASGCTTNVLERCADGTERCVSYTWTDDYRLAGVSVDGEPVAEYAYDVLGNLVAVANDEESFEILVDNGHSLADVAADGRTLRVYMRAPGVDNWLGFVDMTGSSPVPYFYVTDHLGSVLAVTDANGNLVERYEYDAWGKVLSVTDANGNALARSAIGNRILWQGREYSWTTSLYYFRNRWYDPTIGRWISKDPIGIQGGLNLYEFCMSSPVANRDPRGEDVYLYQGNDTWNPVNNLLHQAIAVDVYDWTDECKPEKIGIEAFSFAANGGIKWNWSGSTWLGHDSHTWPGFVTVGEIYRVDGEVPGRVVSKKTTTPQQDRLW